MIEVDSLTPDNLERIYELTQRTNQLNFSGTRYERSELVAMMNVPGRAHVVRCSDRFGDYGIVGFVVADPHAAVIESFFMSCRVQRKHVEHALFGYLQNEWGYPPVMRARFRQTEKNGASVRLLESLGFVHAGDEFVRHGQSAFEDAAIVRLRTQPTGNKARA
jgi:FkbH-like protein